MSKYYLAGWLAKHVHLCTSSMNSRQHSFTYLNIDIDYSKVRTYTDNPLTYLLKYLANYV